MTKTTYIERGSKASLYLWLSYLPACARQDYQVVWISGEEYGVIFCGELAV